MTGPAVVVLAAGHGTRMGGPKLFARYEGQSFGARILARCGESDSPVTLAIDPAFRARAEAMLAAQPAPRPALVECDGLAPMLATLQAVLRSGEFPGGFWCWPVDAPFLSAPGWAMAVETARGQPEAIWKLYAAGESGHPIWLPGWSVADIRAGDWPDGLRGFLSLHEARVRGLHLDAEELRDFNTPEELAGSRSGPEEIA